MKYVDKYKNDNTVKIIQKIINP